MTYNLKIFCYYLIQNNTSLFANFCMMGGEPSNKYRYNINLDRLKEYLRQINCNQKIINFYIDIVSEMKIFNCDDIKHSIEQNVSQLTNLHKLGKRLFMIIPDIKLKKSNFFYSLLTLYLLAVNNIYVENIYSETSAFLSANKNLLYNIGIICDDVSYSGKQLSHHLNNLIDYSNLIKAVDDDSLKLNFVDQPNTYIFLSLVAILPKAQRLITGQFHTTNFISGNGVKILTDEIYTSAKNVFSKHLEIPLHYDDSHFQSELDKKLNLYHHYYLKNLDDGTIFIKKVNVLNLGGSESFLNLSFVILFQKYPDTVSTYPSLCGMDKIKGDTISLNIDNLVRVTGMTRNEFINKVKDSSTIELNRLFNNEHRIWFERIRDNRHNNKKLLDELGFLDKCNNSEEKKKLETISEMKVRDDEISIFI